MSDSLELISRASRMLAEADTIQKAKELKNLALTAMDWAKRKGMGEETIQYARSYACEAEKRIGELVPAVPKAESNPLGRGKVSAVRTPYIPKQRLSEFRKLSEIPISEFKERIEIVKAREEKISYNKLLKGEKRGSKGV